MLIGNKSDLAEVRKVKSVDVAKYAKDHGLAYIETSAKTGENVESAFNLVIERVIELLESNEEI